MFFLNLSAGEFFTLLGAIGGVITALYLLDRSRRKKVVSTLRFWTPALTADERQNRKRMREPWSLVLQLISLLLLLLAIAQLQWGSREDSGRDDVLLLDTSSWSAARTGRGSTVLEREKAIARQYLRGLPARDRVLLVRADALATPALPFTSNREQILNALDESTAEFSALNIGQALSFARQAQRWAGGRSGEILYVGPERIGEAKTAPVSVPNLRVIPVPLNLENCGIRRMGVKRSDDDPRAWQAAIAVKNYGADRRSVRLLTEFGGTAFAPRVLTLPPGGETEASYTFETNVAGRLGARIEAAGNLPSDDLSGDDRAALALPKNGPLRIAVYTNRPDALRPLLEADRRLAVNLFPTSAYIPSPAADLMLLDQFAPLRQPALPSVWIQPPKSGSPLSIKAVVNNGTITWESNTPIGSGLHSNETRIQNAEVFETFEGDVPAGNSAEGPVVVARAATGERPKLAVIGFDPLSGPMRFEVVTPLLFANVLRWLAPESFRTLDIAAGAVGPASVVLAKSERPSQIRVTAENGFAVPFTIHDGALQLFVSRPSIVHIQSGDGERILSLTLADVGEFAWKPPAGVAMGLPAAATYLPGPIDLWIWLACLGGLGLFVEWMLFGRQRVLRWRKPGLPRARSAVPQRERELVSK